MAKTLSDGFTDFLYWVYAGVPPGTGGSGEAADPPRWRFGAYGAVSGQGDAYQAAFKGRRTDFDGIYLRPASGTRPLATIAETGRTPGQPIDPEAPPNALVTSVGIERDGFRSNRLALALGMVAPSPEGNLGWAGVYVATVPPQAGCAGFADLPLSSPFCANVVWQANRSITLGCVPGLYCPYEVVSRLSMAAFLNRLGTALTSKPLTAVGSGAVDLDGGLAVCQTTDYAVAGYPRQVSLVGILSGTAASAAPFEVTPAYSLDAGASWLPLAQFGSQATVEAGHWATARATGTGILDVGATVRFGLLAGRGSEPGTADLTDSRCSVRALIGNRNGDLPPYDARQRAD
jgi:hypothetical protein